MTLTNKHRHELGSEHTSVDKEEQTGKHMGGCQNYAPFLGPYYNTGTYYLGYPKRDPDFDNHPHRQSQKGNRRTLFKSRVDGLGFRV